MTPSINASARPPAGLARYAWFVLVLSVGVILWGAVVRATGSGAGCGGHWPDCLGQAIPRSPALATLIELSHRLSSGLALLAVLVLVVLAFRRCAPGSPVRRGAAAAGGLIVIEAILGAGLVVFGLTAKNDSVARAVVVAVHLANTFLLLGALALTAWWASGGAPVSRRARERLICLLGVSLAGLLVLSMAGAVTALGDTLFPAGTLLEGVRMDASPTAHFLVRLRLWHPALAFVVAVWTWWVAGHVARMRRDAATGRLGGLVRALLVAQLVAGALNLVLLAPVWLQVVHLLLADVTWIGLVLMTASTLGETPPAASSPAPGTGGAWAGSTGPRGGTGLSP